MTCCLFLYHWLFLCSDSLGTGEGTSLCFWCMCIFVTFIFALYSCFHCLRWSSQIYSFYSNISTHIPKRQMACLSRKLGIFRRYHHYLLYPVSQEISPCATCSMPVERAEVHNERTEFHFLVIFTNDILSFLCWQQRFWDDV